MRHEPQLAIVEPDDRQVVRDAQPVPLAEYQRRLFTTDQIRDWCATAATITIKPVIDLNTEITSPGYRPSETLREQVILRDRFCPFPFCENSARHGDLDHIEPYDPTSPPGQTTTSNLASC